MSCCHTDKPADTQSPLQWLGFAILVLLAGLGMNLSLGLNLGDAEGATRVWLHAGLAGICGIAILTFGRPILSGSLKALWQRRVITDQLFVLGICGAYALSLKSSISGSGPIYYEVVLILLAINRLGRLLLGAAQRPLHDALEGLFQTIATARFRTCCGKEKDVPIEEIEPGDTVIVKAGERIPVDGKILEGEALIYQVLETGVPYPVRKVAGEEVIAGTSALDADLVIESAVHGRDRRLDSLRKSVESVMQRESPLLSAADRWTRFFVPIVVSLALLTFFVWLGLDGIDAALLNSLSVVVVACPCAFGLALPMLFRFAVGKLVATGMIPDSPNFLEALARIRAVVFDKTGTLADADLTLSQLHTAPGVDPEKLQRTLGAIQARSVHPVAKVFHEWAGLGESLAVDDIQTLPGQGVSARVDESRVMLGNRAILTEGQLPDWAPRDEGQRRIYVLIDGRLQAVAELGETLITDAAACLRELDRQGLEIAILTGDDTLPESLLGPEGDEEGTRTPSTRGGWAVELNATGPGKARFVVEREKAGCPVLFLGDGLNDVEAMNAATAGIAVAESHELTSLSSRAVWPQPRFAELPPLLHYARAAVERAHFIAKVAFSYNAVGMTLAALGLIHPVIAALLMLASSFTVSTLASRNIQAAPENTVDPEEGSDPTVPPQQAVSAAV